MQRTQLIVSREVARLRKRTVKIRIIVRSRAKRMYEV